MGEKKNLKYIIYVILYYRASHGPAACKRKQKLFLLFTKIKCCARRYLSIIISRELTCSEIESHVMYCCSTGPKKTCFTHFCSEIIIQHNII